MARSKGTKMSIKREYAPSVFRNKPVQIRRKLCFFSFRGKILISISVNCQGWTVGYFANSLCKPQNHSLNSDLMMALMTGLILNWCWSFWWDFAVLQVLIESLQQRWRYCGTFSRQALYLKLQEKHCTVTSAFHHIMCLSRCLCVDSTDSKTSESFC